MTATIPFPQAREPLRAIEAALLGALFLGLVARLSLPAPAWLSLWLLLAPAAALAMAAVLRLSRRGHGVAVAPAVARVAGRTRRPAQAVAMRRRGAPPPRRARRLLAALALR